MKLLILFAFVSAASCLLLDNYNLDKLQEMIKQQTLQHLEEILKHPLPDPHPFPVPTTTPQPTLYPSLEELIKQQTLQHLEETLKHPDPHPFPVPIPTSYPTFPRPILVSDLHNLITNLQFNPALGKREAGEIFTAHVKDELNHVVDIVKAAAHAAELVKNTLVKGMQTVTSKVLNGENDIKEVVHRIVEDVKAVISHMEKNNIFDLDVGKLFESIIPKALSKMLRVHKRGLVLDLLSGLKNTVVDTLGLETSSFSSLKPFLGNLISSATSHFTPTIDNLKALAHTFLEHAGKTTAAVALQAVKFFAPFKAQIGSLFNQIKQLAAKLTGHS